MRLLPIIAVAMLLATAESQAAVPGALTAQGRLTDSTGVPLPPGSKSFAFRIFNASTFGTQIWPTVGSELQAISSDAAGLWSGRVGSVSPLSDDVFSDTVRWLEVTVSGTTLPRVRLVTGPYAQRVATIDGAKGGKITSGLDYPRLAGATLANNLNGVRWQNGSSIQSAFGLVANGGLWFQADWDCNNCVFGVRRMTIDGSLGAQTFYVEYDGDIIAKSLQTGEPFGVGVFVGDGNVSASGFVCAQTYACPSDARLKEQIKTIAEPLDQVERLRGVTFAWKPDQISSRKFATGEQVGLIAQEVREVMPQAVIEQSDGYLAVDYARLVPLLIESIKEQQHRIEKLEAKIESMTP